MRHQDLTINHILESWVFANATARNAAGSYVSGDIGRIGFQSDNGVYYRLLSTTPTWRGMTPLLALLQTTFSSPPTTTSATGVHCGLGGSPQFAVITPVSSPKVFVIINGTVGNSSGQAQLQIRYGTGAAPSAGAGLIGTAIGGVATVSSITAPFSLSAILTVSPDTTYWMDLAQNASAGTTAVTSVSVCAKEVV